MSRSVWKGPFVDAYLLKKAETSRESGRNEVIKIWSRRSTILPQFVGLTFGVYNGHKHIPVAVTEEMIGQKFGEYSPTRTYYGHAADKKTAPDASSFPDLVDILGRRQRRAAAVGRKAWQSGVRRHDSCRGDDPSRRRCVGERTHR